VVLPHLEPGQVKDPASGKMVAFEDAPADLLATTPACWVLHPGETWHGFEELEDGYCMLDPIKVTVLTPGIAGRWIAGPKTGFPATLLTAYLHARGIEVEKTSDFGVLFLFSIGITKAKWGTLLTAMIDFKRDYDDDAPLSRSCRRWSKTIPNATEPGPARPRRRDVRADAQEQPDAGHLQKAFSTIPEARITPADAYQA
jgi:arginine decarboxylase